MKILAHEISLSKKAVEKKKSLREIAHEYGISGTCLRSRLHRHPELTITEAASLPSRGKNNKVEPKPEPTEKEKRIARQKAKAARNGVPWKRAQKRIWLGWDEDKACSQPYVDHEERGRRGGTVSYRLYGPVGPRTKSAFYRAIKGSQPSCEQQRAQH